MILNFWTESLGKKQYRRSLMEQSDQGLHCLLLFLLHYLEVSHHGKTHSLDFKCAYSKKVGVQKFSNIMVTLNSEAVVIPGLGILLSY